MSETFLPETSKTALVVIDLQNGIVNGPRFPYEGAEVVKNAAKLARAFRSKNMPVFFINVTPSPDMKDRLNPRADIAASASNPSPEWAELVKELGVEPTDIRITKRQWGAFYGTELDLQMRRRGIDTIVLCGISTNVGVESTARQAYEFWYHQIFAEDAMSAASAEEHENSLAKIFPRIGMVRKTDEIVSRIIG